MRNVKYDHALPFGFYMLRKLFSHFLKKYILGLSKAIVPLPCNGKFECSVHIFRGPWFSKMD